MNSLTQSIQEAMPEIKVADEISDPEGKHTKIRTVKYVIPENTTTHKAIAYIFEENKQYRLSVEPAKTYSLSSLRLQAEIGTIQELEKPAFIKKGEPIFQAKENIFYISREAERTYVSRRSLLPSNRSWSDILKIR